MGLKFYRSSVAATRDHYGSLGRLVPVDATMLAAEIVAASIAQPSNAGTGRG